MTTTCINPNMPNSTKGESPRNPGQKIFQSGQDSSSYTDRDLKKTSSNLNITGNKQKFVPSTIDTYAEEILQWWKGRIEEVHEDYFVVYLKDIQGVESVAEIDISSVLDDQRESIKYGAEFAAIAYRQTRRDSRPIINEIQFLPPYLWTDKDEKKIEEIIDDLFPDESFFND